MYTTFARIYDSLMRDVDYDAWALRLKELLQERGVQKGARVCECACGTGSLTLRLAKSGFRMTGVDLSGDMLEIAMDKCRSAGLLVPFVKQDMRMLSLPRRSDAVLSTCDGVNYLLTESDLCAFFRAAHAFLKPGGAFVFDVSTPHKLQNVLGNTTLTRTEEDFAYIWHNRFDEKKQQVHLMLTLFTKEKELYLRTEEIQTQRAWDRKTLRACLADCGFTDIRIYGRLRKTPPRTADDRWMISCVKA